MLPFCSLFRVPALLAAFLLLTVWSVPAASSSASTKKPTTTKTAAPKAVAPKTTARKAPVKATPKVDDRPTSPALALRWDLNQTFASPALNGAQWGAVIASLDSSETFYSHNSNEVLMPASNLKLFTTAAALSRLGSNFRYETRIYTDATKVLRRDSDVLDGNLYIVGAGDPTFSPRYHDENALAPFEQWARELKTLGIQTITGSILGDDWVFDRQDRAEGWPANQVNAWYEAEVRGLSLNDNCFDVCVSPGKSSGSSVLVRVIPSEAYGTFKNTALTGTAKSASALNISRPQKDDNIITISGKVPLKTGEGKQSITVHDPSMFFLENFKSVLASSEIRVAKESRVLTEQEHAALKTDKMTLLASYQSPP